MPYEQLTPEPSSSNTHTAPWKERGRIISCKSSVLAGNTRRGPAGWPSYSTQLHIVRYTLLDRAAGYVQSAYKAAFWAAPYSYRNITSGSTRNALRAGA
jgi:hypothetical protein